MRAALIPATGLLAALAASALAQTDLSTVAPSQALAPQAAENDSSVTAVARVAGPAPPAPPLVAPSPAPVPVFQPRSSFQCADFERAPGGGWSALAAIALPGPRGPVQITPGQSFTPGDYGPGFDVAAVLERDCPQAPPPR